MVSKNYNLHNKTASIACAAVLLGVEHVLALLESEARVILTDINKVTLTEAAQFLCSDASLFLNTQNIIMDSGRSTW